MLIVERALRDRSKPLMWWTLGVGIYCAFILGVWPVIDGNEDFDDLFDEMPDALTAMFGSDTFADFSSPTGFLSTYLFSMILPFIFSALAISMASSLVAGEEENGLGELVLSYPIARRRLHTERTIAMVAALALVAFAVVLVIAIGREPVALDVGLTGLAAATIGSLLFAAVNGTVALLSGAITGSRGAATGAGWGVALGSYLINVLASIDDSLDWLAPVSPMHWATGGSPLSGTLPPPYAGLIALVAALFAASLVAFERHDLH
ncbi:MAG: ABC transporter permease subunit [Ilumatobacter sp.]